MPGAGLTKAPIASSVVVLVCALLAAVPETGLFAFERSAILSGQIWRLWSGHWVHFSFQQFVLDAGTLLLVSLLAEREFGSCVTGAVTWLGMPIISLGLLLLAPDLREYRGASGLAVLLAWFAGSALWFKLSRLRLGLAVLALFWIVKTMLEAAGWAPGSAGLPADVRVAWQAHVLGAVLGWVCGRFLVKPQAGPSISVSE